MLKARTIVNALIATTVLFACCPSAYSDEGEGGQAGAFLRRGIGARAAGMGGAYTAIADDAMATYWNPAGLGQVKRQQLAAMYSVLTLDRTHNFASFVQPLGWLGSVGFSWMEFGVGEIDGRDGLGTPTTLFSDSETAFAGSFGTTFADALSIGGTVKYLANTLADNKASGMGYDVGVLLKLILSPSVNVYVGAVAQNIDCTIEWDTESKQEEQYPKCTRLGIAVRSTAIPICISGEISTIEDQETKQHGGAELWLSETLGVRAGYDDGDLAFGGSLRIPLGMSRIQLDYALTPDIAEESAHLMSVTVQF